MHAADDVLEARVAAQAVEPRVHSQPGRPARLILMPCPDISRFGLSRGAQVHDVVVKRAPSRRAMVMSMTQTKSKATSFESTLFSTQESSKRLSAGTSALARVPQSPNLQRVQQVLNR